MNLSFLKHLVSARGIVGIALVAFAAGAASGAVIKGKFADAERLDEARKTLVREREAARRAIEQAEALRTIDHEITVAYIDSLQNKARRNEQNMRELRRNVPTRTDGLDCRPTRGAIRVLNDLRASHHSLRMPEATSIFAEPNLAPSATGELDHYEAHADCIQRYNNVALQLDMLIDWIERQ
jgi:hypothetical protein